MGNIVFIFTILINIYFTAIFSEAQIGLRSRLLTKQLYLFNTVNIFDTCIHDPIGVLFLPPWFVTHESQGFPNAYYGRRRGFDPRHVKTYFKSSFYRLPRAYFP